MSVAVRQAIERAIASEFVRAALDKGLIIGVDNGDNSGGATFAGDAYEYVGTSYGRTLEAMFLTDDERVYVIKPGAKRPFGWVKFVYGNEGTDVISDYSTNISGVVRSAEALATLIESGKFGIVPRPR